MAYIAKKRFGMAFSFPFTNLGSVEGFIPLWYGTELLANAKLYLVNLKLSRNAKENINMYFAAH